MDEFGLVWLSSVGFRCVWFEAVIFFDLEDGLNEFAIMLTLRRKIIQVHFEGRQQR